MHCAQRQPTESGLSNLHEACASSQGIRRHATGGVLVLRLLHVGALQAVQLPHCWATWCVLSTSKLVAQRACVQAHTVARAILITGLPVRRHSSQEGQVILVSL